MTSYRGFSYVDLVESARTRKLHAMKRILCHAQEDQDVALQEVRYMRMFHSANIISCDGCEVVPVTGKGSIISEVLILMPFYNVRVAAVQTLRARGVRCHSRHRDSIDLVMFNMAVCHFCQLFHSPYCNVPRRSH